MVETLERCRNCGASLSRDIEWCGQCYTPVSEELGREGVVVVPEAAAEPPQSLPWSTPIWAKVALSLLLVGFGVFAFVMLQNFTETAGSAAWAFTLFFLVSYAALAIVLLALTWRPAHRAGSREPVIVVPTLPTSERQEALRRSQDPGEHTTR